MEELFSKVAVPDSIRGQNQELRKYTMILSLFWKYTPVASAVNMYFKYFHESEMVF